MLILLLLSSVLSQMQKDVKILYGKIKRYEVSIYLPDENIVATGTVVDRHTVITAGPIKASQVKIRFDNKTLTGKIIGMDEYTGITTIDVKNFNLKPPVMRGNVETGDILFIFGNSYGKMGIDGMAFFKGYTDEGLGILSLPMLPGGNGDGVYNINGELVGILIGSLREGIDVMGKSFFINPIWNSFEGSIFIPVKLMFQKVNKIRSYGDIKKGWLGIKGEDIPEKGVRITDVIKDSPASIGGLNEKDVIFKVGHSKIGSMQQLRRIIENTPPGKKINIYIKRQNKILKKKIIIGTIPERYKRIIPRQGLLTHQ